VIFDRVTDIWIEEQDGAYKPLDYSSSNKELFRVASNFFNSSFIKFVGSYTKNILKIVPKDENGNPIQDLAKARVDANTVTPGIQELKEWETLFEYIETFEDRDGDGLKEIPERYSLSEGRFVSSPSLNPVKLLKRGNFLTWLAFCVFVLALGVFSLLIYVVVKKIRKRRSRCSNASPE